MPKLRVSEIVHIDQGLCRMTVRSKRLVSQCARIPGVRIEEENAEELGYRVIFPEEMEKLIRGLLKGRPRRKREQGEQMDLFRS